MPAWVGMRKAAAGQKKKMLVISVLIRKTGSTRCVEGKRDYPCKHPLHTQCLMSPSPFRVKQAVLLNPPDIILSQPQMFSFLPSPALGHPFQQRGCTGIGRSATHAASSQPSPGEGFFLGGWRLLGICFPAAFCFHTEVGRSLEIFDSRGKSCADKSLLIGRRGAQDPS